MNVKSPVCRIGGKAMLTGWLLRHVPSHTVYCEPFAGGASLLFAKPESKVEILNDIDNCLISLYRCIQNADKRAKLVQLLNETPYSRSVFDTWKYNKDVPAGDIEKAARYFFLSKASFAGDIVSGGFACPSVTGRNPAQTFRNAVDSLEYVASRLKSITLECLPYAEVIRRYDSPGSFFYVDPPYLNAEGYYGSNFTKNSHLKLSELLHGVRGKVMLSHYANSLYDRLYNDFNRYEYESFKGSYKSAGEAKPVSVECLFTNFKPFKTRGLFGGM